MIFFRNIPVPCAFHIPPVGVTGATFSSQVLGSFIANLLKKEAVPPDGDNTTLCNSALVCVMDTGGGNLNNILILQASTVVFLGTDVTVLLQAGQISVTITKYSDTICAPY